jgi:hypothetical protein
MFRCPLCDPTTPNTALRGNSQDQQQTPEPFVPPMVRFTKRGVFIFGKLRRRRPLV